MIEVLTATLLFLGQAVFLILGIGVLLYVIFLTVMAFLSLFFS